MLQHGWTLKHYIKWKKPTTKDHILLNSSMWNIHIGDCQSVGGNGGVGGHG
jgi:hypothetical protein